jgi:hypothetical protein
MVVIENHDDAEKFGRFPPIRCCQARFGNPLDIECHDQGKIVQTGKIAARHAANQSF